MRSFFHLIKKSFSFGKTVLLKIIQKRKRKYSQKKKSEKKSLLIERYELLDHLKANIENRVLIKSENLIHLYQNQVSPSDYTISGRILEVDDDWIKLELEPSSFLKTRGPDYLYFKTDVIIDFTVISNDSEIHYDD